MSELLVPIHQMVDIPLAKLPTASCWEALSPYWPSAEDRQAPPQWGAKVALFRYLAKAWGAISDDSYRALSMDLRFFFAWCRARELPMLPAAPATVAAYIEDQAEIKSKATVRRYLSSISTAHQHGQVFNPVLHEDVSLAFDRLYRDDTREPEQAEGLRWEHIETALGLLGNRPIDLRNRALVGVAYDCLLRQSEVPRLTLEGLSLDDNGGYKLRVIRSKKRSRQGVVKYKFVRPATALAIYDWCEFAGITEGAIFRGINGQILDSALSNHGVNRAIQSIAKTAGLDPRNFSGHSCRIGACQDMFANNIDVGKIMLAGDWTSPDMPVMYSRKLAPDKGGMSDLAALQQSGS